jgi:hypothetical protein
MIEFINSTGLSSHGTETWDRSCYSSPKAIAEDMLGLLTVERVEQFTSSATISAGLRRSR